MGSAGSSWMEGEVLPIIPLSCLRGSGGRVSAHLGEPKSSPQYLLSRWLTRRCLPLKRGL
ncbi:hypothetical protein Hanom_Chr05g00424041 [Helianthus anomalus]